MDIKREVQRRGEAHLDPRVKELETDIKATEGRLVLALDAELEEECKELERKLDAGRVALEKTGDLLCNLKLEVIERVSMRGLQVFKATVQRSSFPRHHFTARQHIMVLRDMDEQEAAEEVVPSKADLVEDLGREPASAAQGLVGPTELLPTAAIWTSSTQLSTTTPPAAPPTLRAAVTGAGPDASPASSSPSNCAPKQHKTALHNSLMSIRLLKTFSALIDYVADDYIIIVTRSKDAWMEVEEREGQYRWAIFEGLDDTGYRRMMAAATALDQFFNCTPDGRVSDDELRIRQVLVGDQGGQLRAQEEAAASCVSWMTPEAQVELRAALDRETALNDAQRDTLQQAAARSFTLMQGPPGTGKSAALVSMVKALCRVFHCPTVHPDRPFMVATNLPMAEWSSKQLVYWLQSFSPELVDAKQKAIILGALQDLTGLWCANATKAKIQRVIAGHLEDDSELEHDAAMGAAEPCAAALLAALEEVKSNPPIPYKATNQQNMRIMVAAESNAAVDRLLAGLVDDANFTGYTVIRMGPSYKVTAPRLAQYSLDVKKSEHKLVVAVRQLKLAFSKGNSSRAEQDEAVDLVSRTLRWVATENEEEAAKPHVNGSLRQELLYLARCFMDIWTAGVVTQWAQEYQAIKAAKQCTKTKENKLHEMGRMMEQLAAFDIVIRAHVVVGTCVALGELRKTQHRDLTLVCPIVLCDEAAQSSECASMVPLTLGAQWALMAGDTKQLCPVLKSTTARSALRLYSSGGSLYGRLQAAGVMEGTLVMQYRMHPVLREFPSNTFYGGRLVEDPRHMPCMDLPKLGGMVWPRDNYPVAFFDLAGRQERGNLDSRGPQSWRNEEEASVALRLMLLVGSDPAVASIAILTPYTAQCSTINSLLDGEEAQALFAQYRARRIFHASACRAYTVDGYQGQEADVVILTTVRTAGSVGHVADPRRLNVAITRARRGLLIVGCASALSSEVEVLMSKQNYRTVNYWPRFIDHIKAKGGFVDKDQVQDKLKWHVTLPMCLCTLEDDRRQSQNVYDYQQMTLMTRKHKGSRVPAPAPALVPAPIQAQA
ncbi:AAA domain-containing protein [Haematococcus lacustris]